MRALSEEAVADKMGPDFFVKFVGFESITLDRRNTPVPLSVMRVIRIQLGCRIQFMDQQELRSMRRCWNEARKQIDASLTKLWRPLGFEIHDATWLPRYQTRNTPKGPRRKEGSRRRPGEPLTDS